MSTVSFDNRHAIPELPQSALCSHRPFCFFVCLFVVDVVVVV